MIVVIALAGVAIGCDREQQEEREGEVQLDETEPEAERIVSAYSGLEDVDPIEPADVGPEGPAIYFLSSLKGYTEPCGCTVDVMLGGIDRITAYAMDARALHPAAHLVDAGDWIFETREVPEYMEPQERAKAEVIAAAHRKMGTLLSVPGARDLALGPGFYQEMMEAAGMTALGANLRLDGQALQGGLVEELQGAKVLYVGAGDPAIYEEIQGAQATAERAAIEGVMQEHPADVVVLVYQGSQFRAASRVEELDGVDFVIVGQDPQLDDDAVEVGGARIVQAFDQGRYMGRIKLYNAAEEGAFVDGRAGARPQRELIDQQIERVRRDLRRLEVRAGGEHTPMADTLQERLEGLEERRRQLLREAIEIPDQGRAFLYEPVAMEPGYRLDEEIYDRRMEFNRSLAELNAHIEREVIPVEEGEPFFIGTNECATCHVEAHQFWTETSHASAVATLENRHKQFDQNCIGCHVVGWEQPGGSVLGKIEYDAELNGHSFRKDLNNVGCESCHGAGSNHRLNPLNEHGNPQHIERFPTEESCAQCHVPDHSPTFDFGVYVERITGDGHELRSGRP